MTIRNVHSCYTILLLFRENMCMHERERDCMKNASRPLSLVFSNRPFIRGTLHPCSHSRGPKPRLYAGVCAFFSHRAHPCRFRSSAIPEVMLLEGYRCDPWRQQQHLVWAAMMLTAMLHMANRTCQKLAIRCPSSLPSWMLPRTV